MTAVGAVLALSSCGLPMDGPAQQVPTEEVPLGLLARPTPSATASTRVSTATSGAVYFVDAQQRLVAVPAAVGPATRDLLVQDLLNRLAVGPSDAEREKGLTSNIGLGSSLVLSGVTLGMATIEYRTEASAGVKKLPALVGQIVLTATSVEGIERVQLTRGGQPLNPPGAGGQSTYGPLSAADYASLLAPGQPPVVRAVPLPTASR